MNRKIALLSILLLLTAFIAGCTAQGAGEEGVKQVANEDDATNVKDSMTDSTSNLEEKLSEIDKAASGE